MDLCKGFQDWLYCIRCPYICTKSCPIENEDAIRRFSVKLRDSEGYEVPVDAFVDRKTG